MRKLNFYYIALFKTKRGMPNGYKGKTGRLTVKSKIPRYASHREILMQSNPNPKLATPALKPCKVL